MSIKIFPINKHIAVDLFEISSRTRSKRLPTFWEQALVFILRDKNIVSEPIQSIGYLVNKRGFHVKTKQHTYFIRVLFTTNIPLPYIIRRVTGQDECCARAHTLNENLAQRASDHESEHGMKYGSFYTLNILPCKTCFNKYSVNGYISHVDNNRHPDFEALAQTKDFNLLSNLVLIWLMREGNAESVIDLNDTELFDNYRINHVRSINRFFTSIAHYCRAVITSIDQTDTNTLVRAAHMDLQVIMNSCLDICADINNRPLQTISLDECYGYSEFMARYRQNAQNIAFALRYTGNECQVIHIEDDIII